MSMQPKPKVIKMAKTETTVVAPATVAVKKARKVTTIAHRINAMLKTQTIKGSMSVAELDEIIAQATRMKKFAEILASTK
jgi:hypothetical protein